MTERSEDAEAGLQLLNNLWYLVGLPVILLILVFMIVLVQVQRRNRAIAALTGDSSTSSSRFQFNWKPMVLIGVLIGIVAVYATGIVQFDSAWIVWTQDNVQNLPTIIEQATRETRYDWHPWRANFWQALTVLLGALILMASPLVKENGSIYHLIAIAVVVYVGVAVLGWFFG